MKKCILIIILIVTCLILSGCVSTTNESYLGYPQEHKIIYGNYAVIKEIKSNGRVTLVYDINTRIMYQIITDASHCGICEYYIRVNNKSEIAIYGYNYKGE